MIFEAYVDDSKTLGGVVMAAGFLAPSDSWQVFEEQWLCALDKWGLEYFHMADFESGYGPYINWTKVEHEERLDYLLTIIQQWTLFSFGVGIQQSVYDSAVSASAKKHYGPFGIAAAVIFKNVYEELGRVLNALDTDIAYFFEDGSDGYGQVERSYRVNKERFRLNSVTRMNKHHPPCQAADILAYELGKDLERQLALHKRGTRYPLTRLKDGLKVWTYPNESALRAISDMIDAAPPLTRKQRRVS